MTTRDVIIFWGNPSIGPDVACVCARDDVPNEFKLEIALLDAADDGCDTPMGCKSTAGWLGETYHFLNRRG